MSVLTPLLSVSVSFVPDYISLILTGTPLNTVNKLFDPAGFFFGLFMKILDQDLD